jgi:ribosome biogenesis protein YTM1
VNALLGTAKPIPFEFLINGTFLHTSIDEYLTANGISAETVLTVEYVRATIPPSYLTSFEHDDWVGSVDVLSSTSFAGQWGENKAKIANGRERILSGGYDGLLRIWTMSSEVVATSPAASDGGHTMAVKDARFISQTRIASAGMDRTVRIWKYAEDGDGVVASITPYAELYGHKANISSLAVHHPSSRILSASDDHTVGVWSTSKADSPPAPAGRLPRSFTSQAAKRQKLAASSSTPRRGPLALLAAHTDIVTATIFGPNDATVAHSVSRDHTLRTWDLATGAPVDTRTASHALFSVCALPALGLLAAGTSARHITLVDRRASATSTSAMTLRGHTNKVGALARDPDGAYGLVSASYDGTCRVWDVRASRSSEEGQVGASVYTIGRESAAGGEARRAGGEGLRVFDVCWDARVGIVSGGEDRRVQVNRGAGRSAGDAA